MNSRAPVAFINAKPKSAKPPEPVQVDAFDPPWAEQGSAPTGPTKPPPVPQHKKDKTNTRASNGKTPPPSPSPVEEAESKRGQVITPLDAIDIITAVLEKMDEDDRSTVLKICKRLCP